MGQGGAQGGHLALGQAGSRVRVSELRHNQAFPVNAPNTNCRDDLTVLLEDTTCKLLSELSVTSDLGRGGG
ncbi:hypothetical protein RRG08_006271 [Elysia crispata]|uniref:Uncharacterized protein n=1 Tax=Elysia crispata TaxID=231223 RepID=A0AAE1D328_9GAST|nr:hypothetical protein RRG08_006271 [Elysia crispata]